MVNWHTDKKEIVQKTINAICNEIESLGESDLCLTANYWIDDRHNVFAEMHENKNGDRYLEIHYELYDANDDIIGDIDVMETEDLNHDSLMDCVTTIVNDYYRI